MSVKKTFLLPPALLLWLLTYLNMQWFADWVTHDVFKMNPVAHLTQAINFFLFEVPKVMLLLILIIFIIGIIRSYFSAEKTRKALEGKSLFTGNVMASVLGIVTPFCSCSAIPLFLGFVEAGIPIGVTFSFLIAAPLINEVALVLLIGLFGWKVALIYVVSGLLIAILAGFTIEKLQLQKYVAGWVYQVKATPMQEENTQLNFQQRVQAGWDSVKEIVGKIWIYILIGIAIGAGAHGFVPNDFLSSALGDQNWYSVPLAILVGVPLYSNAAGIIPIVSVLIEKGVSLGTALAFMMSVIGLSLPEVIILKKVLRWQLISVFIGVVALGIILIGFTFNYLIFN